VAGLIILAVFAVIFVVVIWLVIMAASSKNKSWATTVAPLAPPSRPPSARRELEKLQQVDPNFSLVLFDDFLVALYTEIRHAHARGTLARYAPYLVPEAAQGLGHPVAGELHTVLVGSARIDDVQGIAPGSEWVVVTVGFETNVAGRGPQGEVAAYLHETWTLRRRAQARSRTPDKAKVIGCPSCGAPLDVVVAGVCKHCSQQVSSGAFDWLVVGARIEEQEARGPMLTGNTEEEGTDFPTVAEPDAQPRFAALQAQDPALDWNGFMGRVGLIFSEFQGAWAQRDLARMRPFFSDTIFQVQNYWVDEYKRQGLRNVTENARIFRTELARVASDAFYDSVTIRVYAVSQDYTVADADNRIVSGSREKERTYTEYWTLIRGRGVKGAPHSDKVCPKCGAPLNVNMAGHCTYCQTKITTGGFDWVLSRIEQDDVYAG
jgi:predicted lipid-binding transport protein (Tim44 family)